LSPDRIRLVAAARPNLRAAAAFVICILNSSLLSARSTAPAAANDLASAPCPRPAPGASIPEPTDLRSSGGELHVTLTIRSAADGEGHTRYCYLDPEGHEAPTLRVRPGDTLYLKLLNRISAPAAPAPGSPPGNPCAGGTMSAGATNLHFHGLSVPPLCHQDETLRTLVQPGAPPFEYRLRIAPEQPPGLYWYHPHVHGFSEQHLLGGASGAIVVEGIERLVPEIGNLPQRVLIVRDEWMPDTPPMPTGQSRPTKQLSINYVPVRYPGYVPARLGMRPGARELWRVLNASADTYLLLYLEFAGKRQLVGLIARDGVPLAPGHTAAHDRVRESSVVFMPPGARTEFIVRAPDLATSGRLMTGYVNRGADEAPVPPSGASAAQQPDSDPTRPLATIDVSPTALPLPLSPAPVQGSASPRRASLAAVRPVRSRTLYFSEAQASNGGTDYFITAQGATPAPFDPSRTRPDITVRQGDVEDWKIENRSREVHTFHVHQLHFLVVERSLQQVTEPDLLDTVDVPAWRGVGSYPSVTLRMDFRDPRIVGLFPFHCHIAQHLDGGMMGTVRVLPARTGAALADRSGNAD
jgi:FtsP/CotA-like multicopper oxidase with cupredoxin domain